MSPQSPLLDVGTESHLPEGLKRDQIQSNGEPLVPLEVQTALSMRTQERDPELRIFRWEAL